MSKWEIGIRTIVTIVMNFDILIVPDIGRRAAQSVRYRVCVTHWTRTVRIVHSVVQYCRTSHSTMDFVVSGGFIRGLCWTTPKLQRC